MLGVYLIGSLAIILGLVTLVFVWLAHHGDPRLWSWVIWRHERRARRNPPARGSIVLAGSSSIWFWKTMARDLAPLPVVNHGFGGSHVHQLTHFVDRLITPFSPSVVVLYSGDNDLAGTLGPARTPDDVDEAFGTLITLIRRRLPTVAIVILTVKPSPLRHRLWPAAIRTNALLSDRVDGLPNVSILNVSTPLLDEHGRPKTNLFKRDRLHLNQAGYALWAARLKPELTRLRDASLNQLNAEEISPQT
ncbi:MAG: lysophospholipase L1-like esterase [Myxococcota bacterium]